jgi:collagenase-like PrtC family protease
LLDLVKRHAPRLKVSISTFAVINSPQKARVWEGRGADRLILYADLNRNFKALEKVRRAVKCELELFANVMCLYQCPFPPLHAPCKAHASSTASKTKGFTLDYYAYTCAHSRMKDPVEFVRGRFVRPEDVAFYRDLALQRGFAAAFPP